MLQGVVLEAVAAAFTRYRLAVFPVFGIYDFLDARKQDGMEVIAHFDEQVFAVAAVFSVQVDDGMGGGAGTGEVIEDHITRTICCGTQQCLVQKHRMAIRKITQAPIRRDRLFLF